MKGKTIVITGGSRGIGLAIALRYAKAGCNVVIATKDTKEALEDTSDNIEKEGGKALVIECDVSDTTAIQQVVTQTINRFNSIDILVNNTSRACFSNTMHTTEEQFDLVVATSVRAAFFMTQACLPYLKEAENPHIINHSPPLNMDPDWFKEHLAFSLSKYAMSMCTLGMAEEFRHLGIAVNSLWPKTTIATPTITEHFSPRVYAASRWPSIMADAAFELGKKKSRECTGHFFTDEELLREGRISDFSVYAVDPSVPLMQPLFTPKERGMSSITPELFL